MSTSDQELAKKFDFHTSACTYGSTDWPEGDYCSCGKKERRESLIKIFSTIRQEAEAAQREKTAELIMKIDNTYLGPQYREKLAQAIRSQGSEGK